jgi:hypothetical protein
MWPEKFPSKYFRNTSSVRSLIRPRSASPTLMLFPETRRVIWSLLGCLALHDPCETIAICDGRNLIRARMPVTRQLARAGT